MYSGGMSKVDRNNPKRSTASESQFAVFEFLEQFPDDAACLEWLVQQLYPNGIHCPKCDKVTKHYKLKNQPVYSCEYCGHHEHPMAGTIFQDSATSLKLWFYAIFLMASTRCGISAKQLEREIGVTYKTAYRMFKKIRSLLEQDECLFSGEVEADESYVGGTARWKKKSMREGIKSGRPTVGSGKTPVAGIAQRGRDGQHGFISAIVVPNTSANVLLESIHTKVLEKCTVYTDEYHPYDRLGKKGYTHKRVHHSAGVYVDGDVHTNTLEGFWSLLKRGISGVYHGVSAKHLQTYCDEYVFRYNNRSADGRGVFSAIMERIEKEVPA
jgi:transposase